MVSDYGIWWKGVSTRSLPMMECGVKFFNRSCAVLKFGVQLSKKWSPIMEFGGKE